jgi:branched-chain amino acid aminotransferase
MADVIPFDQRDGSLWYDGKLVPWKDAKTHVLTHGLHYGSCVFEGQRIYNGKIYKLKEHTARLFFSAETLGMKIPFTQDQINQACIDAAAAQNIKDGYLRPVAFRGSEMMAVSAQNTTIHVAIACWPWPSYFSPAEKLKGIRLDISRWKRPSAETEPVHAKAAGLYMICTISKHEAEAKGYADALMFDYRGYVAEATGANVFFVKDGELHTPTPDCFPQWSYASVGDCHRQGAPDQGGGASHQAGRVGRFQRMFPHRFGRRSDAGVGDRLLALQAGPADRDANECLCR